MSLPKFKIGTCIVCALSISFFTTQTICIAQNNPPAQLLTEPPDAMSEPTAYNHDLSALFEAMHPLDGSEGPFAVQRFKEMGKIYLQQNADLLSLGADLEALKLMAAWPLASKYPLNQTAIAALSHALTAGNIKAADVFWDKVKSSLDFEGAKAENIAENYPQVIIQLVQAGRRPDAILLARKLLPIFNGKQIDASDSYRYTDYQYRHDVLKACAIALAGESKVEALAVCDQLFDLDRDNQWLGEMYLALGQKEKASACYKRAIALEEKRRAGGAEQNTALPNPSLFDAKKFNSTIDTSATYALLNRAHQLIEQGIVPEKEITELVNLTDDYTLNKPAALLNLVRNLSDHKMIKQSNDLLAGLSGTAKQQHCTPITALFLATEQAINSVRSDGTDKQKWNEIENYLTPLGEFSTDRFRILALAYATAGDFKRAKIIQDHALPHLQTELFIKKNSRGRILFLLDQAAVYSALGDDENGQKQFDQAMTLTAAEAARNDRTISATDWPGMTAMAKEGEFRCSLVTKIVNYIIEDSTEDNKNDRTEKNLRAALNATEALAPVPTNITSANNGMNSSMLIARAQPAIRVMLARHLMKKGDHTQANDILSKVDQSAWDNSFGDLDVLRAELEAAAGNWNRAMEIYLTVPFSGQTINPGYETAGYTRLYLTKALEAAKKLPSLNSAKLAFIYHQLAMTYDTQPYAPEQAIEFYKQAYSLYPDTDSNKSVVAQKIAQTEQAMISQKSDAAIVSCEITKPLDHNTTTVIEMLHNAALLAEKNQAETRVTEWLNFASAEAQAGLLDSAIEHAQHAISIFHKPTDQQLYIRTMELEAVVSALSERGKASAAEQLLIDAAQKVAELFGQPSMEYETQQAQLFRFYYNQENYNKALEVVDQILAVAPQTVELNRPFNDHGRLSVLNWVPYISTDRKDPKMALELLNKSYQAYQKYYAKDDYRMAHLLKMRADLESSDNFAAALSNYEKALAIAALNGGSSGEYYLIAAATEDFLIKNGKAKELALLRKQRDKFELVRQEFDLTYRRIEPVNIEAKYFHVSNTAPYSEYAAVILDTMLTDFEKKHDTEAINKYVPLVLDVLNHTNYFNHYFAYGQLSPLSARYKYLKMIIAANSRSDFKTAKLWLQKAHDLKLPLATVEELTFLSQAELLCGNRQSALEYYKQACKLYLVDNNKDIHREALIVMRKKLGQREDLKSPGHPGVQSGAKK